MSFSSSHFSEDEKLNQKLKNSKNLRSINLLEKNTYKLKILQNILERFRIFPNIQ